jgi:hypothetical protein
MSVPRPSLPRPSEGLKTGRPQRRPNPRLSNHIYESGEQTVMWLAFLMLAFVIGVAAGYAVRLA